MDIQGLGHTNRLLISEPVITEFQLHLFPWKADIRDPEMSTDLNHYSSMARLCVYSYIQHESIFLEVAILIKLYVGLAAMVGFTLDKFVDKKEIVRENFKTAANFQFINTIS